LLCVPSIVIGLRQHPNIPKVNLRSVAKRFGNSILAPC
jgi:hypothetical protein